jgi:hypothetical protein
MNHHLKFAVLVQATNRVVDSTVNTHIFVAIENRDLGCQSEKIKIMQYTGSISELVGTEITNTCLKQFPLTFQYSSCVQSLAQV